MFCKAKSAKKLTFLCGDFRQFSNKNVQRWDHFFPLLFPKDSKPLKIWDIQLREVGAKRRLNGTSKMNTQTHGQTHRRSFRLIESIGPEGQCFENICFVGPWNYKQSMHCSLILQGKVCITSWISRTNMPRVLMKPSNFAVHFHSAMQTPQNYRPMLTLPCKVVETKF